MYLNLTSGPKFVLAKLAPFYRFVVVMCALLFCGVFKTQAQDFFPTQTDFGFRIGMDYELPGKNLKDDYKGGLSYNLGFLWLKDDRITISANFSYRQFNPKYPLLVDDTDPVDPATATTSPYQTYVFYLSAAYHIDVAAHTKLYGAINIGSGIANYEYSYKSSTDEIYIGGNEKIGYVAPKLGAKFALSNTCDLDIHALYNIYTTGEGITYNSRTGGSASMNINTAIAAGVGLIYKF